MEGPLPPLAEPQDALDERREFYEQRNSGIGATDTPKILGLSKHGTALTVYNRLTGPPQGEEQPASSLPAWMGLRLQSTVGELYTEATGYRVRAARQHYRHRQHEWLVCHLDFRVWGHPYILVEAKTRAYMRGWGEDGTAHIPEDVWAQCQHEMAVTGALEVHVAVLFGHHTFRVYRIPRDEVFIEALIPQLGRFWHDNVLARVPPPPTGHWRDQQVLAERYPEHGPFYRNATPSQQELVASLRASIRAQEQATAAVEDVKAKVKDLIGTSMGLIGPFGEISWKKTSDVAVIDHAAVANEYAEIVSWLMDMVPEPDTEAQAVRLATIQEALRQGVTSKHTTTKEGSRRFLVKWADEER